jgi:hypothetical protein
MPKTQRNQLWALQAAEKLLGSGEIEGKHPAGAKAQLHFQLFAARLKSCPKKKLLFTKVAND